MLTRTHTHTHMAAALARPKPGDVATTTHSLQLPRAKPRARGTSDGLGGGLVPSCQADMPEQDEAPRDRASWTLKALEMSPQPRARTVHEHHVLRPDQHLAGRHALALPACRARWHGSACMERQCQWTAEGAGEVGSANYAGLPGPPRWLPWTSQAAPEIPRVMASPTMVCITFCTRGKWCAEQWLSTVAQRVGMPAARRAAPA